MATGRIRPIERKKGRVWEATAELAPRPDGTRRQQSKTFDTKRAARDWLNETNAAVTRGTAIDPSRQTVAELVAFWLESYARPRCRPITVQGYEHVLHKHALPRLGQVPIQKLTAPQVQHAYAQMRADGVGERTIELCHQRLGQAFSLAVKMGWVARNVVRAASPPRPAVTPMQVWDETQAHTFITATRPSVFGPIWHFFLASGFRREEVLGLRWRDLDWSAGTARVGQVLSYKGGTKHLSEQPKTPSARRVITLDPAILAALREHRTLLSARRLQVGPDWTDLDLVFPSQVGTHIHPSSLDREFKLWLTRTGLPRLRIHDLRHTHATLLLRAGEDIAVVSKRLGHAKISITYDLYIHVLPDQHAQAARTVARMLGFAEQA